MVPICTGLFLAGVGWAGFAFNCELLHTFMREGKPRLSYGPLGYEEII
jgi:hypothetical protein